MNMNDAFLGSLIFNKDSSGGDTSENYIYNIGQCAFNTEYVPKINTKIIMKATPYVRAIASSYGYMFSSNPNANNDRWFGFEPRNGVPYFYRCNTTPATGVAYTDQSGSNFLWGYVPQIFEFEGRTARWYREETPDVVNSLSVDDTVEIKDGLNTIALFAKNYKAQSRDYATTDYGCMLLYYFDIYENDVLLHHFVPTYNNNQYCLKDKVNNTYIYDTYSSGANVKGFVLS